MFTMFTEFYSPTYRVIYLSIPKPPIPPCNPRHLTRVKLRIVGNLTQNEARQVGNFTFLSKRLSGRKQKDFAVLDSASEPRSRIIALVDSTWVFVLLLLFYMLISWNMTLFKAWSKDKLNKKFVLAENCVCIKG